MQRSVSLKTFVQVYLNKAAKSALRTALVCPPIVLGSSGAHIHPLQYNCFPGSCGNSILGAKFLFCRVRSYHLPLAPFLKSLLKMVVPGCRCLEAEEAPGFVFAALRAQSILTTRAEERRGCLI